MTVAHEQRTIFLLGPERVELRTNPHYFGTKPKLPRVVMKIVRDPGARLPRPVEAEEAVLAVDAVADPVGRAAVPGDAPEPVPLGDDPLRRGPGAGRRSRTRATQSTLSRQVPLDRENGFASA